MSAGNVGWGVTDGHGPLAGPVACSLARRCRSAPRGPLRRSRKRLGRRERGSEADPLHAARRATSSGLPVRSALCWSCERASAVPSEHASRRCRHPRAARDSEQKPPRTTGRGPGRSPRRAVPRAQDLTGDASRRLARVVDAADGVVGTFRPQRPRLLRSSREPPPAGRVDEPDSLSIANEAFVALVGARRISCTRLQYGGHTGAIRFRRGRFSG